MTVGGSTLQIPRLFGPEMHEDPYPIYRELRDRDPVHWDEGLRAWVLTRYEDAAWALKTLSSDRVTLARRRFPDEALRPLFDVLAMLMLQRDDPDHARIRGLVHKAFLRTSVERWHDSIRRRVRSLLEPGLRRGHMDFIEEFAVPLPVLVISELVGIPEHDRERVKRWCDDFSIVAGNFYAAISLEQLERGLHSTMEFRAYLADQVDELRRAPRQDLLSSLVQVEEQGVRLTLDELLANALLLLNAGNETTTNLLGNGLAALLRHPDQLRRLRSEPALVGNAVEEFLRFDSPVQFVGRVAAEDVTCAGQPIRRGELVVPVLAAANRDPSHFPDPDRLDVARAPIYHLAFGHGHHHCVGAELGRLEARITFETLLTFTTLDLGPTDFSHHENFNFRGYRRLPVHLAA